MTLSNEYKNEILSIIKSDYGCSGGKCVTKAVYNIKDSDKVYKEVERLSFTENAMGSGYGVHTHLNKNIRKHIGVTTEQLLRVQFSSKLDYVNKYKTCFLRQLRSAYKVGKLDMALEMCEKITGNNNNSINNMYLLSRFSDAENIYNSKIAVGEIRCPEDVQNIIDSAIGSVQMCSQRDALLHREAKEIISMCLNRSIVYFTTECKVRDFGVVLTVSGNNIHGGEVDIVTRDSVVDIKVKENITVYDVLQILAYARIMKLNKHKLYKGIKYAKLVNPFNNTVRTYEIRKIPKEVWDLIDDDIISTHKQLSLFDLNVEIAGNLNEMFS